MKSVGFTTHNEKNFPGVKRLPLFWPGLLAGTGYAIVFYLFLNISGEAIRLSFATGGHNILVLTDGERWFWNFFFAFVSALGGQSVGFTCWYHRPRVLFGNNHYHRISIVNDHRGFHWIFIHWFSKMAIGLFMIYGYSFQAVYLSHDYTWVFILLLAVLFLNPWLTIRRVAPRPGLKYMFISFIVINGLAFSLAWVNPANYKNIEKKMLDKNIVRKYSIRLPEAGVTARPEKESLLMNLFVPYPPKTDSRKEPFVIIDKYEIALPDLLDSLRCRLALKDQSILPLIRARLYLDRRTDTKTVKTILTSLNEAGIGWVCFAVTPQKTEPDTTYYNECCTKAIKLKHLMENIDLSGVRQPVGLPN